MPKVRSGERLHEYRNSYNYRAEYFKRNPGLFGCIWFCSQCYKPLFGRKNVVIDHIVPLSKGGRNHVSNCTAICWKCNRDKSDKIDARIIKGGIFKFFESNIFRANRGVGAAAGLTAGLTAGIIGTTLRVSGGAISFFGKSIFRSCRFLLGCLTLPLRKGSIVSRLVFLILYVIGILYVFGRYTNLLDFLL